MTHVVYSSYFLTGRLCGLALAVHRALFAPTLMEMIVALAFLRYGSQPNRCPIFCYRELLSASFSTVLHLSTALSKVYSCSTKARARLAMPSRSGCFRARITLAAINSGVLFSIMKPVPPSLIIPKMKPK